HARALAAIEAGKFDAEIVPVEVKDRKGNVTVVDTDEGPRPGSTPEVLSKLRPVTSLGEVTTAGNSSTLNDGAWAVIVASQGGLNKLGLKPRVGVVANAAGGLKPEIMAMDPVLATREILSRSGWELAEVGGVELNDASGTQSLACMRELGLDEEKTNAWGGAIALVHPLGSSCSRITLALLNRLETEGGTRGIATICIGVGQGTAIAIE